MLLLTIPKIPFFLFSFLFFQNVKIGGVMRGSSRKEEAGEGMLANEFIKCLR